MSTIRKHYEEQIAKEKAMREEIFGKDSTESTENETIETPDSTKDVPNDSEKNENTETTTNTVTATTTTTEDTITQDAAPKKNEQKTGDKKEDATAKKVKKDESAVPTEEDVNNYEPPKSKGDMPQAEYDKLWQHFKSLKGIFQRATKDLKAERDSRENLELELNDIRKQIKDMRNQQSTDDTGNRADNAQDKPVIPPLDSSIDQPRKYITEDDDKNYGEFIGVARRAASEEIERMLSEKLTPILSDIKKQFETITRSVGDVNKNVADTRRMTYSEKLKASVPDINDIYADPMFVDWANKAETIDGRTRGNAMVAAEQAQKADIVISYLRDFKKYRNELLGDDESASDTITTEQHNRQQAQVTPQPETTNTTNSNSTNNSVDTLIAPPARPDGSARFDNRDNKSKLSVSDAQKLLKTLPEKYRRGLVTYDEYNKLIREAQSVVMAG